MENQKHAADPIWTPTLFPIRKIAVSEKKPVLYYLDGEYAPSRKDKIQYPQRILLENRPKRLVYTTRVFEKLTKAEEYAERSGGVVLTKTGKING